MQLYNPDLKQPFCLDLIYPFWATWANLEFLESSNKIILHVNRISITVDVTDFD